MSVSTQTNKTVFINTQVNTSPIVEDEHIKEVKEVKRSRSLRKPSPYIVFCNQKRPEVKKKNPNLTFGQLGLILSQKWLELSEEEKKSYRV